MSFLVYILTWLNVPLNAAAGVLLAPVGLMPGWLSNTIAAAVSAVILLIIFKYTSNQRAIAHVRNDIKANMLALKLFKDSLAVIVLAQCRLLRGAMQLLAYAIVPLMVMIVPVSLLLGQLGLWYQSRPLLPGEETVVVMKLNGNSDLPFPLVRIESIPGAQVVIGPVRVLSDRRIFWKVKAHSPGRHHIVFQVNNRQVKKQLAIGDGFMRVSAKRPGWNWVQILYHPLEKPFAEDTAVRSISIDYPQRQSWTSGSNSWLIYFFAATLVFSLAFKPFLKVRI